MASGIKLTYEQVKQELNKFGYKLLSKEYVNAKTKINIEDNNGYRYSVALHNVICDKKPNRFYPTNTFTLYNLDIYLKNNGFNVKIITKKYTNQRQKIHMVCECGNKFSRSATAVINKLSARCDECAEELRRDNHSINPIEIEKVLNDSGFYILEYPDKLRTETKVTCIDDDGYKYYITSKQVVWQHPIPFLTWNPYTIENIKHYIKINNIDAQILSKKYNGNFKYMDFKCGCGREYKTNWQRFKNENATRCQVCSGYQSTIAYLTEQWLIKNEFDYDTEVTFEDINNKQFGKLRFDFKIGDILIEVDGIQHFEPVGYFGGEDALILQQERDEKKNQYCINKSIKLVRIPYWEFDSDNYIKILSENLIENNPSKV